MLEGYKGVPSLYDDALSIFSDVYENVEFFNWIRNYNNELQKGQVCYSVVSFYKRKKWYLQEHNYNPRDEQSSTWYARQLTNRFPKPDNSSYVKKYFDLGLDESLITVNSKIRPVILLERKQSNWWNPSNSSDYVEAWTCLPLFSYKSRHNQQYVLNDQKLLTDRFYIPPFYSNKPGIEKESSIMFDFIQNIPTYNIKPLRHDNSDLGMRIPFKVSDIALRLINFHMLKNMNILNQQEPIKSDYDLFCEYIGEILDEESI